jgi:hypothetical protein
VIELGLGLSGISLDALILQLYIEISGVETLRETLRPLDRLLQLVCIQKLRDDARHASRGADDPVTVLLELCHGGAWLVIHVVYVRFAD